ncbi:MAG: inositol monophosphatase family protein [Thermoplasmata archaeon]
MRKEMLETFKECAIKVSEALESDILSKEMEVGQGADGTPTKRVDQVAEEAALDFLLQRTDASILSEEAGIVEREGEGYIIMDPIDGTNNAILDIPFYCISLAYTPGSLSELEVGYVKNLSTGDEYYSIKGEGSFKNGKELDPIDTSNNTFCIYLGRNATPESTEIATRAKRVRSLGSAALSICMVAEGVFDLFYHCTPDEERSLRITDLAAATLILREVGGEIYGKDMLPLNMEISPDGRKDVIALYDEDIKEELP